MKQDNDVDANKPTKSGDGRGSSVAKMRDEKDNKWERWELPCQHALTRGPNLSEGYSE
jgi:hypothetical protein